MMKRIVAYIQLIFSFIFLWPHCLLYLTSKNNIRKLIYSDMRAINDKMSVRFNGISAILYVIFRDPFYRKMFYHRIGIRSFLVSWYFPGESSFHPICSSIGESIYLAHPTSTYLNAQSIGSNFTCRQNTTIGNKTEGNITSRPVIGNNVSVGANVCIIGDVTIGDNVIIGAGSVVVKNIPSNSIAVGNPARIISK